MKLPQTLIIESPDQKLRENFVQDLVKSNLCLSPAKGVACHQCKSCVAFDHKNHPDLIRISKLEDQKYIPVETIRDNIISKINSRPLLSEIICVLIENAQELGIAAQNALLKTLEEPPSYVRIILSIDRSDKLLPTILSRAQIHKAGQQEQFFRGDRNFIREIVDMDLIERFQLAKRIADTDKKENRKDAYNSLKFIDDLILGLREVLRDEPNNADLSGKILPDLNKILDGREKILYNTNKQLVLENLMIQTLDQGFYSRHLKQKR